jgi:hypothetical protein
MWNVIIPAITGIIGVIVGSFTPIINWHVESKKLRREDRKLLLKEARDYFEKNKDDFFRPEFAQSILYSRIRSFLSQELIKCIEDPTPDGNLTVKNHPIGNYRSTDMNPAALILDELQSLERKWKII